MKILVVDDNQLNLVIVKKYLDEIEEITEVYLCSDPNQVKSMIDVNLIDIVLLDIIMPDLTGIDLLRILKGDKVYDDIPVIMLTSVDDIESYRTCFELGAFDYITKPINEIDFYARLKVAIESKNKSNYLKSLIEMTTKQNEELKEMNAKLTEAKFSLVQAEKMAAIGQLAAGIAHEINNPMGFVNSNFEILQKYFERLLEFLLTIKHSIEDSLVLQNKDYCYALTPISDKFKELKIDLILQELDGILSDSANGLQRITEIVQSLRVFARSTKDDDKDTCVLLDLIKQVTLISKNEIKYVAKIELDIPNDIILYCNRVQIGQVFINMLVNAAQAIKSQNRTDMGFIRVYARKIEQEIIIRIEDDGPGIPEENLPKLFEPFFTTKEIGQGTGLGLSISYDIIVNKHHGFIDVKSKVGRGTVFTILLPIVTVL